MQYTCGTLNGWYASDCTSGASRPQSAPGLPRPSVSSPSTLHVPSIVVQTSSSQGPPCPRKQTSTRRRRNSLEVRGFAERAESTESERFKEPTDLLLSGSEVSPRTNLPAEETSGAKGRAGPFSYCFRPERWPPPLSLRGGRVVFKEQLSDPGCSPRRPLPW